MSDSFDPRENPADLEIGRVEVILLIGQEGDEYISFRAETPEGDDLSLLQALGILELAKDTVIRTRMEE